MGRREGLEDETGLRQRITERRKGSKEEGRARKLAEDEVEVRDYRDQEKTRGRQGEKKREK